MDLAEESAALFLEGYNCSQAVFLPQALARGLDRDTAARLASGFGAGMGRQQRTCGALTGAFLALGLIEGFSEAQDGAGKSRIMGRVRAAALDFERRFGSQDCATLLGCDLNTEEGQRHHKESGQRKTVCLECVRHAAFLAG